MQIITSSSYNDITLTPIDNGTNLLTNHIILYPETTVESNINTTVCVSNIYEVLYGCIFNNNITIDTTYDTLIFCMNITIYKDIINNNIHHYTFIESLALRDPSTYLPANQQSNVDNFTIVWFSDKKDPGYGRVRMLLHAFDSEGNKISGPKITSKLIVYYM